MHFPNITAVISFCSNDWRFLKHCIAGVKPFCKEVLITVCDHFFDGSEENYALLEHAFSQFPNCRFLEFAFDPMQTYRPHSPLFPEHLDWRHEWHNTGRWISYFYSSRETEYLFFLDSDEILNKEDFALWLETAELEKYDALRLRGFHHFRQAKFEALEHEDLSLLVRKKAINPEFLWDEDERMGLFYRIQGEKKAGVCGTHHKPMMRHFGGVRTKQEWIKKCATWGHHWERKWSDHIENEFAHPFSFKDFIRQYHYRQIDPVLDPLQEKIPILKAVSLDEHLKGLHRFSNVIMVSKTQAFKKQLENEFALSFGNDH